MSLSEQLLVAIDLGTTTIAGLLLSFSGEVLARAGGLNPQRELGLDVVSRLTVAQEAEGRQILSSYINDALSALVEELLKAGGVTDSPALIAVAGNTVMQHFLLGLPTDRLDKPPYRPLSTTSATVRTATLGWHRDIPLYVFPQPGGFVGGDLVAFLYGQFFQSSVPLLSGPRLFLDLGTNAEIALVLDDTILSTAAAAGPAFEAGNLSCGMVAVNGAINSVVFSDDRLALKIIGGGRPRGMCGSGVISLLAGLLRRNIITSTGHLLSADRIPTNLGSRCEGEGAEASFVLYKDSSGDVRLTQPDIRQLQLALAAVGAGIEVLLQKAGLKEDGICDVTITGSFGASLDPDDLERVGLLPSGYARKSRFVVDGALEGVMQFLISSDGSRGVDALSKKIQVIPLSGTPVFEKLFIRKLDFKE